MEYYIVFFAWFIAGTINNIAGFGAAMVAMPIMAFFSFFGGYSVAVTVPSCTLIVLCLNLQLAYAHRKFITWSRFKLLFIGCILGSICGIFVVGAMPESFLKIGMGVFLLFYGICGLISESRDSGKGAGFLGLCAGFLSSLLGLSFGFNGPPLAAYVAYVGWPQRDVKAMLGAAFILSCFTIIASQLVAGLHSVTTFTLFLIALPGVLLGGQLGIIVARKLGERSYHKIIHFSLIFMGCSLLVTFLIS
ncbi:MAG: sulfite exporter TauE/SafE family protein [Desulfotalea sp.]